MSFAHILFIPGTLLLGVVLGYVMGLRAAQSELRRRQERMRE
jgi:uncharacterized protein YneF (UPF0154 family)